jgi:hypothetical protein
LRAEDDRWPTDRYVEQPHHPCSIDTGSLVYFENEWDCSILPLSGCLVRYKKIWEEEKGLIQLSSILRY